MKTGRPRRKILAVACLFLLPLLAFWAWARFTPCPHPMEGLSFSRVICDRDGAPMRIGLTPDDKYRIRTHLEDIPKEAIDAVIRYEDRWFWQHPGVNAASLLRAGLAMARGGRVMGGSTLTMQVARLALGLRTGSLRDKLLQIAWAFKLEQHFSKAEILECYFNMAPYGGNVEGLAAAAMVYFHKAPSRLTPSESMVLMLVPQNPAARRPSQGNARLAQAAARLQEAWTGEREHAPLRVYGAREMPFACPHLSGELLTREDLSGQVISTIDRRQQDLLEQHLTRFAARGRPVGLSNAAALLVHWPTVEVRALAGSAGFGDSAISGQIDGTRARRSPGSTLKPAIYALALDQGLIHPRTLLADMPRSFSGYDPENFDSAFRGPLHADEALRLSRNLPALTLAARLAPPGLYGFLREAGFAFEKSEEHYGLSLVLGGAEVTMRELAALYAALPNGGTWRPLSFTLGGAAPAAPRRLLSPEACFLTLDMLTAGSREYTVRSRGKAIPLRVKTGTSNGFRDAWAAGIFGDYVLVVWAGNFDNASSPLLVGGKTALPLFCEIARSLAAREPMRDRLAAPPPALNLEKIKVCSATGDVDTSLCPDAQDETWFIPGVSPVRSTGILRPILIDKASGLRACVEEEGRTEKVPWEFWTSEFRRQFQRAGIAKPDPPPFLPECAPGEAAEDGPPPDITLPKAGLVYHVTLAAGGQQPIALMAHASAGVRKLFWFSNGSFLGETSPGETLSHVFAPGEYLLRVTDDAGRTSVRRLTVRAAK